MFCEADILILILQAWNQKVREFNWFAQGEGSSITMSIAASIPISASIATIHFNKLLVIFRYNCFLPHSNVVCHPLGYDKLET